MYSIKLSHKAKECHLHLHLIKRKVILNEAKERKPNARRFTLFRMTTLNNLELCS